MRLSRMRSVALVALPVGMLMVGFASGASQFVPYKNATRQLVCSTPNDCRCKQDWPIYGESTWVFSGTYRSPLGQSSNIVQLGAWQCGNDQSGADGEIYQFSCAGFPTLPHGATKQGTGYFEVSGCN